jgi:flagellar secretion chaperone FliS
MDLIGYNQYQTAGLSAQISSASPVQLVLVLTNALLDELARVSAHIQFRRYEAKGNAINKCIDLLTALSSSLDLELGGKPVADLARLYDYMTIRLNEAGVLMDTAIVDEVRGMLTTLHTAWCELEARSA